MSYDYLDEIMNSLYGTPYWNQDIGGDFYQPSDYGDEETRVLDMIRDQARRSNYGTRSPSAADLLASGYSVPKDGSPATQVGTPTVDPMSGSPITSQTPVPAATQTPAQAPAPASNPTYTPAPASSPTTKAPVSAAPNPGIKVASASNPSTPVKTYTATGSADSIATYNSIMSEYGAVSKPGGGYSMTQEQYDAFLKDPRLNTKYEKNPGGSKLGSTSGATGAKTGNQVTGFKM